jgi:hypothetical protein
MVDSCASNIPSDAQETIKQKAMRANVLSGGSQAFMALNFIGSANVRSGASYPRLFLEPLIIYGKYRGTSREKFRRVARNSGH